MCDGRLPANAVHQIEFAQLSDRTIMLDGLGMDQFGVSELDPAT